MPAPLGRVVRLVVHHSASPLSTTLEDIDDWHRARGWSGCGYHRVVEADGRIREGRPIHDRGAHVKGRNVGSLGVCVVGDNTRAGRKWTQSQLDALAHFVRACRVVWPELEVGGHRDYATSPTECPGVNVRDLFAL